VNLCSRSGPYSLNRNVGTMLVFRMLCRITQSSDAHRTESVSVMDHEQTMGVNSKVLDQKQQNIFGHSRCSGAWNCKCFCICPAVSGSHLYVDPFTHQPSVIIRLYAFSSNGAYFPDTNDEILSFPSWQNGGNYCWCSESGGDI